MLCTKSIMYCNDEIARQHIVGNRLFVCRTASFGSQDDNLSVTSGTFRALAHALPFFLQHTQTFARKQMLSIYTTNVDTENNPGNGLRE